LSTSSAQTPSALAKLLGSAKEAIIAIDTHKHILFCNESARRLFDIPDDPSPINRPLQAVLQNQELLELLERQEAPDRVLRSEISLREGAVTLNAQVTTLDGVGRVVIMQDITALKEIDRIKSEFVHRVSRDIRSPLTTILGYVELIARVGPVNEEQQRFIDRITFSVQSITALLSELLELSRVEADFDADRELTNFSMVLRYAIEGARRQFEARNQKVDVSLPKHAPMVLGNPLRLRQMINNLLENASAYTPPDGAVQITLVEEGDFVVLRISDNGIGIPAGEQAHVFERFYRASNAVKYSEGTGLGLAIVKSIVDGHDGRIWVESEEGKGSTFTIMLPAYRGRNDSPATG